MSLRAASILLVLAAAANVFAQESWQEPDLIAVAPESVPIANHEGDLASLKRALHNQRAYCLTQNLAEVFRFGDRYATREEFCVRTAEQLVAMIDESRDAADLAERARAGLDWYQSRGSDGAGLVHFTAYNTPTIEGSLTQGEGFPQAIYDKPADLEQVMVDGKMVWRRKLADGTYAPHEDRHAIDVDGALRGQGLEIAWAKDPVEVYYLHVEGSGVLKITHPDGRVEKKQLHYSASNGHPYTSLGRYMREQGVPERYLTIPGAKRYFRENPHLVWPYLTQNKSYVFFHIGEGGPKGSLGLELTGRHSIAVDSRRLPMGAVALTSTERPLGQEDVVTGWQPFSALALTQDIGGAIQGPGRVDIYWGEDEYASFVSGTLSRAGSLYFALARPAATPAR